MRIMERLRKENDDMRAALTLVDRYFMSLAAAWNANEDRLMDKTGRPIVEGLELNEICEEAANAVAAIMRPNGGGK